MHGILCVCVCVCVCVGGGEKTKQKKTVHHASKNSVSIFVD